MSDSSLEKILYINDEMKNLFNNIIPKSINNGNHLGNVLIVCNDWQVIEMIEVLIARKSIKSTVKMTSLPAIEQPGDLAALLTSLDDKDVMLIAGQAFENDNIYCLLKNAMENYTLEMEIGKGPSAQLITLNIPKASYVLLLTELSKQVLDMTHLFDHIIQIDNVDLIKMKTLLTSSNKKISIDDDIYKFILEVADSNIETAFQYMIGFLSYCQNNKVNLVSLSHIEEYLKINNIKHPSKMSTDETIINLLKDIKKSLAAIHTEIQSLKDDFNTTGKETNDKLETIDDLIREMFGIY